MAGTVSLGAGGHGIAINVDATELVEALNATIADVTEPAEG
jgi:Cys-tRNA(Pro)/Cys-tRNA(Cys) deacylase